MLSNKIIYFILFTAFVVVGTTCAQQVEASNPVGATTFEHPVNDRSNAIDPSLLKEDFEAFRNALRRTHPALYRFKTPKQLDNLFDSCYAALNQRTTEMEFFATLKFLSSAIEDGHLYCGPSPDFKKFFDEDADVFPLQIKFIKSNAYVICDNAGTLPPETELLSINDVPINSIRRKLFRYIVADGGIQTGKYGILSDNFWFYYYLVYGRQTNFVVNCKTVGGKLSQVTLKPTRKTADKCVAAIKQGNYLQLTHESPNVALLTIKTFSSDDLAKSNENFTRFLQATFKELKAKQVRILVIDVRGNGGGRDDYGSLLYSYLTAKPFDYYASLGTVAQQITRATPPDSPVPSPSGNPFRGRTNLLLQRPSENNFTGPVFFLIDGSSFSTATEFCSIARSNNRGKFVGEETGGGYYGNTSGNSVNTVLPNTKITVSVPTTKYVMAVKKAEYGDRGIIPDYAITPTIDDIAKGADVQLNFALKLARQK